MRTFSIVFTSILFCWQSFAQNPKTYTSSEVLAQVKKLNVLGSVLYIAAHPDDENTRLLAYLANEQLYRTGYLSLTRGDGGQNLIGDEQGIDLGLIRTQELLAARRIDGAEQFFSRAYDFGFCKTATEAMTTWGHDKVLSDVVWVIRKFRPDVIIARFPEDSRAGHGHHAASGILAREAFEAAADPKKFPEQLTKGVSVWQAKRMLWNTFNFGGSNTQSEDQFKLDVGMYNPLLGKGYGEIAALSRSQHKSQGFGVAAQRGTSFEYFTTLKGDKPVTNLMDGVDVSWARTNQPETGTAIKKIISDFNVQQPSESLTALFNLRQTLESGNNFWSNTKLVEIDKLIETASGLFMEATAASQLNVVGDSMRINLVFNNRSGVPVKAVMVSAFGTDIFINNVKPNENRSQVLTALISDIEPATQPYWLEYGLESDRGSFVVKKQDMIGVAENKGYSVDFQLTFDKDVYTFSKPLLYRYTDPVKGEIYQPVQIVNPVFINSSQNLVIFKNDDKGVKREVDFTLQFNKSFAGKALFEYNRNGNANMVFDSAMQIAKGDVRNVHVLLNSDDVKKDAKETLGGRLVSSAFKEDQLFSLTKIRHDHIPDIFYNYYDGVTILKMDLKTAGKRVGYIAGAGDKVPQALEQMGYQVVMLGQADIATGNLKQYDAIVTGVRAYNTNDWMNGVYDQLMQYVNAGGVLLVQYNTSNQIGPVRARISPYPFTISRNRITDETARVNFLLPNHPALNYPNKISEKDFEGWIQERSIYNAERADSSYQRILSMQDPDEQQQDGSLIVANYGKGKFVYTGLVFFRELPAGVPGAYRLFANLLAPPVNSSR